MIRINRMPLEIPPSKTQIELAPPMKNTRRHNWAFTLIELIAVIAVIAVLAASLLPALARTRPNARRVACANNLKQVCLSFRSWATDHNGRTPMNMSQAVGGDAEDVGIRIVSGTQAASRGVSKMFLTMSNQLSTPKVLFCPAEFDSSARQAATTFAGVVAGGQGIAYINDLNVSYFIGVDASETFPRMFLTGDHNLGNGNPPITLFTPYYQALGTNFPADNTLVGWLDNQHRKQGNIGLADSSVEWFSRSNLQEALKNSGDWVRYMGPGSMPAGLNRIQLP